MIKSVWADAMAEKGKRNWDRTVELLNTAESAMEGLIVKGTELESMIYVERAKARLRMKVRMGAETQDFFTACCAWELIFTITGL